MKKNILILILLIKSISILAQDFIETDKTAFSRKGKLYFYWGWNGSDYTKSNISFSGDDYSFTLKDVKATDRQSEFSVDKYLNPANMTIPQYNFRLGYYFSKNWDISFGIDHMKYVMVQDQNVSIDGTINSGSNYDGGYYNDQITLSDDFLKFEHTDGLNYVNTEIRYNALLLNSKHINLEFIKGIGLGILYPKTNTTLLNKERYDDFHLSGWGIGGVMGLRIEIFKRFFIQTEHKYGYINMPNIRTTLNESDSAQQSFFYSQRAIVFGGIFNLSSASKIKKK